MPLCERCQTIVATGELARAYQYEVVRKVTVTECVVVAASSAQDATQAALEPETSWEVADTRRDVARARRASGEVSGWVCRDVRVCERRRARRSAA